VLPSQPVLRTSAVALVAFGLPVTFGRLGMLHANPAGVVATTATPSGAELAHAEVGYEVEFDRAVITREAAGDPEQGPLAPLLRLRQLEYRSTRQLLTPRLELGVYRGVWVSFAAPIVLAWSHELSVFGGTDRTTTSTFVDGILPANGFDARAPTAAPGGDLVLRDVDRAGIPELRGGLGWAPMIQALDDTKPTWKLGADVHLAVGKVMRFDPVNPAAQTGVSTGVHELRLWTSVDRRFRYFEGWFEAFWQRPLYTRASSQILDPGFGATHIEPAPSAGMSFGASGYIIDDPATGNQLSVEIGARLTAHFDGRGYSEMWQAFALAGDSRTAGPLVLDADPTRDGVQAVSHPGVSNIESYLETAARLTVRGKLGAHVTLAGFAELVWNTEHVISFAEAGVDLPTCPTGAPRCEAADNDLVNPGTQEVNPLHVKLIDLVGHRYHAEDSRGVVLGLEARLAF
jgi:hypothetical protein